VSEQASDQDFDAIDWDDPLFGDDILDVDDHSLDPWESHQPLAELSQHLLEAELMDFRAIPLAGASVTLPEGSALVRRVGGILDEALDDAGYAEYMFPALIAAQTVAPAVEEFPEVQNLLFACGDDDFRRGTKRAVLTPTGESAVYSFWAQRVRSTRDLPIRLRQTTSYFRPVSATRSGQGPFRSMEAPEVHEFHACLGDRAAAVEELARVLNCCRSVVQKLRVPTLWSQRPRWGNNAEISLRSFGGDAPLPSGGTIQVGAVYDQGQRFARAFRIKLRDHKGQAPFQVAGCMTRRLLLAHLFQGLDERGNFHLHPSVAAVQVDCRTTSGDSLTALLAELRSAGVRARPSTVSRVKQLKQVERLNRRQGVPVQVLVQPPRPDERKYRVVVSQGDEESVVRTAQPENVVPEIQRALDRAAAAHCNRTTGQLRRQIRGARQLGERAKAHVRAGGVAIVPLSYDRDEIAMVQAMLGGEVLGLRPAVDGLPSAVSGRRTVLRAAVSRRI
jgi:prolyl-tRNA synthetase